MEQVLQFSYKVDPEFFHFFQPSLPPRGQVTSLWPGWTGWSLPSPWCGHTFSNAFSAWYWKRSFKAASVSQAGWVHHLHVITHRTISRFLMGYQGPAWYESSYLPILVMFLLANDASATVFLSLSRRHVSAQTLPSLCVEVPPLALCMTAFLSSWCLRLQCPDHNISLGCNLGQLPPAPFALSQHLVYVLHSAYH